MKTNGNAETAGIEKPRQHNFLRLWGGLVQRTFPFMEEEVGELGPKARLFVTVCETVVKPETFKRRGASSGKAHAGIQGIPVQGRA